MESQIPYILEIRWNLYGAHKYGHPRVVKSLCIRRFLCKSDLHGRYLLSPSIFFQQDHVKFAVNIMICLWQKKSYKHSNFFRKMFGWISRRLCKVILFLVRNEWTHFIGDDFTASEVIFLQRLHSLQEHLPSHFLSSKGVYNLTGIKNSFYFNN